MLIEAASRWTEFRSDQNWVTYVIDEDGTEAEAAGSGQTTGMLPGFLPELISQKAMAAYCSEDASVHMMPDAGTAFAIQATISYALQRWPELSPLCFVSRGPDERGERLILQFVSDRKDLASQLKIWDELVEWLQEFCNELARAHQVSASSIFESFSVIVQ